MYRIFEVEFKETKNETYYNITSNHKLVLYFSINYQINGTTAYVVDTFYMWKIAIHNCMVSRGERECHR